MDVGGSWDHQDACRASMENEQEESGGGLEMARWGEHASMLSAAARHRMWHQTSPYPVLAPGAAVTAVVLMLSPGQI